MGAPAAARSQSAADSIALARLAARLAADEVPRHSPLDSVLLSVLVERPQTRWDSAVARELRALRPDAFRPPADTLRALHIGRVGLTFAGTVTYLTVSSSGCQPERPRLDSWTHVLRYEVTRADRPDSAAWRVVGPPEQTFLDGICGPATRPKAPKSARRALPPAGSRSLKLMVENVKEV